MKKPLIFITLILIPLAFAIDWEDGLVFRQSYSANNPNYNDYSLFDTSGFTSDGGIGYWKPVNESDVYCYQETANVSTACGGLDTGTYAFPNENFEINYTKPTKATNNSKWMVKHGDLATYNITIPVNCWDAYPTKLVLKIYSNSNNGAGAGLSRPYCYNTTDWVAIGTESSNAVAFSYGSNEENNTLYDGDWGTYAAWYGDVPSKWVDDYLDTGSAYPEPVIYEEAMWWDGSNFNDSWGSTTVYGFGDITANSTEVIFDGTNDYILLDDNGDKFGKTVCNNGCSFFAWVNPDSLHNGVIVTRFDTTEDDRFFRLRIRSDGTIEANVYEDGTTTDSASEQIGSYSADTWQLIGFTFNGSTTEEGNVKIYKDGALLDTGSDTTTIDRAAWADNEDVLVGVEDDGALITDFDGSMANLTIYNRALSDEEASAMYNTSRPEARTSYYIDDSDAVAGYDFKLEQNSDDIFNSYDGTDNGVFYTGEGVVCDDAGDDITTTLNSNDFDPNGFSIHIRGYGYIKDDYILGTSNTSTANSRFYVRTEDMNGVYNMSTIRFGIGDGSTLTTQYVWNANETGDLVIVQNITHTDYYYNGKFIQSMTSGWAGVIPYGVIPICSFNQDGSIGSNWLGTLEKIMFYNRTLSADEIERLYQESNANDLNNVENNSMNFTGNEYIKTKNSVDITNNFTLSFWFKQNQYTTNAGIIDADYTSGYMAYINSNKLEFYVKNTKMLSATDFNTNLDWNYITLVYNGTHKMIYLNGTLDNITTETNDPIVPDYINIGKYGNTGYFNGSVDEVNIYDRALADWEIENLYNSYDGYFGNLSTDLTDDMQKQNTQEFDINFSYADFSNDVNCSANTNNSDVACSVVAGTAGSATVNCSANTGLVNETVLFQPYCTNGTQIVIDNVTIRFDTVNPVITIYSPSTDNSSHYYNVTNVTFNISFVDNGLFGINASCYNAAEEQVWSKQTDNLDVSAYNWTNRTVFSTVGEYMCTIYASDDHTANEFSSDYDIKKPILGFGEDKIKFDDGVIEFVYDDRNTLSLDKLEVIEKTDRVSPKISIKDYESIKDPYIDLYWTIKYTGEAYSREEYTDIPGHYVILPGGDMSKGYWYDADDDYAGSEVTTELKDGEILYHTKIATNAFDGTLETKSLGGLNIVNQSINFTIHSGQNISINASNFWNGSSINYNISTTNGTNETNYTAYDNLTIEIGCEQTNVTVTADGYMNNYTYYADDCNLSNYNLTFWQAEVTVNVTNNITDALVPNANITINDSTTTNNTASATGSTRFFINNDTFTMNASHSQYNDSEINTSTFTFETSTNTVTLHMNPLYDVFFKREETNTDFNFSENASLNYTVNLDVYCPEKTIRFSIDETTETLGNIDCEFDYWYITLESSTDSYYRTVQPEYNVTNTTVWLLDLKVDTAIQSIFKLNDLINDYDDGYLIAKKTINATEEVVIKQQFDVETKVVFWLDENQQYKICAENDNGIESCIGNYVADAAAEETLVLPGIPLAYDYQYEDVWWLFTANKTAGEAHLFYVDFTDDGFTSFNWTILDANDSSTVFTYTDSDGGNNETVTATGLNSSKNYVSRFILVHSSNAYSKDVTQPLWWGDKTTFPGFEDWDTDIKLWVAFAVPVIIILTASVVSISWLFAVAIIFMGIFNAVGWYGVPGSAFNPVVNTIGLGIGRMWILITLFAALLGLMWFNDKRRGK